MEKIKQFFEGEKGKDLLIVIIIVLVGLISFELGRLSKDNATPGIKIEYPNQEEANVLSSQNQAKVSPNQAIQNSTGKSFFASSRGHKYYPLGCSAGKSIKQENRIYFSSREEAKKAGYALSTSCSI